MRSSADKVSSKPIYVFLSADKKIRDKPKTKRPAEDAEATALQLAHRKAVTTTNSLYYKFKDKKELCRLVAAILDCGSLLPLSAKQPAASAGGQTTDEPSGSRDVMSRPDASRLAGESGSRLPQSKGLRPPHAVPRRALRGGPVLGLRRARAVAFLVRDLLTRAWLRSLTGVRTGPESAQSNLDEAWEIAARGPMPLFLADIHLYRARLFGSEKAEGGMKTYPWESPQHDLAEARRLIVKHGYGRRMPELEDAEAALPDKQTGTL